MASGSRVLTIVMHVMSSLPIGLTRLKTMRKCKLTVTYNTISCIVLVHYRGHDSAYVFYVLCDNVFISLLMCVCRITKRFTYLLTYCCLGSGSGLALDLVFIWFAMCTRITPVFQGYVSVHPYPFS